MSEFVMPSLGADMDSGTLLEWYVKPGDSVKRGDIVALVDTNKAEIEVEIFEDGVIEELLVPANTRVPVGTALATVRAAGAQAVGAAGAQAVAATGAQAAHRPRVSPLARRAAEQLGVDLSQISGSGPNGAVTQADVQQAAAIPSPAPPLPSPAAPPPGPAEPAVAPESGDRQLAMRQSIGALMARSKREIPHYYLELEIDMSGSLDWLHQSNQQRTIDDRLLPSALLLAAAARAAADMPEMNGFWLNDAFQPGAGVHLGVAISLRGGGLVAPALHDADRKHPDEIMREVRDLVTRARGGRLRSSEMADPTITVTNLGDRGVDLVHGVIYPPQVALVGFGSVRERPWAADGMLGARPTVIATLAGDHRASDGHTGANFLNLIARHLQQPERL